MTTQIQRQPLQIGRVVRNAIAFNPKHHGDELVTLDSLLRTVDDLFYLLDERAIDFVLVGGIAMLHYVDGRNTEDIDLIMALASLQRIPELVVERQDMFFAHGHYHDLAIDILLTDNRLFRLVSRSYATRQLFAERQIRCATVEGLLLLKLYALPSLYRQGEFARVSLYENDIAMLVQAYSPDLPALLHILSDHLSTSDLAELRSVVVDIQERIARFRDRFGQSPAP